MTIEFTSLSKGKRATSDLASVAVVVCLGSLAAIVQLVKPLREV